MKQTLYQNPTTDQYDEGPVCPVPLTSVAANSTLSGGRRRQVGHLPPNLSAARLPGVRAQGQGSFKARCRAVRAPRRVAPPDRKLRLFLLPRREKRTVFHAESCQRAAAVGRSILNAVPLFAASLGLRCNLTPFFFYMFTTYATRSRTRSSSASSRAARPGPPRRSRRRPGSRPPGRRGRTSRAGRDRPGARADPSWMT